MVDRWSRRSVEIPDGKTSTGMSSSSGRADSLADIKPTLLDRRRSTTTTTFSELQPPPRPTPLMSGARAGAAPSPVIGTPSAAQPRATRPADPYLDPAYLFLQVSGYPDMSAGNMPIPLPDDEATKRAIAILDRTPVVDFHKVGVVYVGPGETTEQEILRNSVGSSAYTRFLNGLGELIRLKGCRDVYTGGLDTEMDLDGAYTYYWRESVTQLIFHVATLMPTNIERDPQCLGKKRHIGNDFVTIVFNDSGLPYDFNTLPSQFNFVQIIIIPLAHCSSGGLSAKAGQLWTADPRQLSSPETTYFVVYTQCRPDMPDISPVQEPKVVSHAALPAFVRQIALHANIFAQVFLQCTSSDGGLEYVANWKERLRQIKRLRERASAATATTHGGGMTAPPTPSLSGTTPNAVSPFISDDRRRSISTELASEDEPTARLEALMDFTRFS
jgi:hypothetical protein